MAEPEAKEIDPGKFIREQAGKGALDAVKPWLALAIALGAIALWRTR